MITDSTFTTFLTDQGAFLAPYLPQLDYLIPAWVSCLSWILNTPEAMAEFRAATGQQWRPGRTPLECQIDQATGADKAFFAALAQWMNDCVWGEV